jgi:dihydroxy-acid dehydratase
MTVKLNKTSARITEPKSQGASQAMLYGIGMSAADMQKAQVGISSVWDPYTAVQKKPGGKRK